MPGENGTNGGLGGLIYAMEQDGVNPGEYRKPESRPESVRRVAIQFRGSNGSASYAISIVDGVGTANLVFDGNGVLESIAMYNRFSELQLREFARMDLENQRRKFNGSPFRAILDKTVTPEEYDYFCRSLDEKVRHGK